MRGVIAAAATPVTAALEPDLEHFLNLCTWLLENGCDGLNICGTTGEATSFSVQQRRTVMTAASTLPLSRLMVGTGAAALGDAVALTRHAAELGFAGALVLPPFYYKGVADDGVVAYVGKLVEATSDRPIDIYLYNFPALSGVAYSVELVTRLRSEFGTRIAGLKDSSGDLTYASAIAAISPDMRVFPSNEAVLLRARAGDFAGCISASANVNAPWCRQAFHDGNRQALDRATEIRALVSRQPLIPSIKASLAARHGSAFRRLMPPLTPLSEEQEQALLQDLRPLLDA